jgi:2-polyprenyl-3-methyl-5-hydroxy-6-metoxy-1,4-benzoquinol methylase
MAIQLENLLGGNFLNTKMYDEFASFYHLIFEDWEAEIAYQSKQLDIVLKDEGISPDASILDVTCGIGTQILGLSALGYQVTGVDLSEGCVQRARNEAGLRGLNVKVHNGDAQTCDSLLKKEFDVVISCDNSLPHLLSDSDILRALKAMYACTKNGGSVIITVRDYDREPKTGCIWKPYGLRVSGGSHFVLYQVWDFDGAVYDFYWYLIEHNCGNHNPVVKKFAGKFYAVSPSKIASLLQEAGYRGVERRDEKWFQPMILGKK